MSTRTPCILVAEPTVLQELLAGSMLREGFLRPWHERLEDTATEEFVEALRTCGFLALSSRIFEEDATTEPLSAEARRDYLSNLEQRLRRSKTVHLHVVRQDDPDDWPDRVADVMGRTCGADGQTSGRTGGTHFLVVVHLCAITEARHSQLRKLEKIGGVQRRYLMTEELHESGAKLVQAEWVWAAAVGRLLIWLQHDEKSGSDTGWNAWQSVDFGPRPSDESLEDTRKAVTQRLLLPEPAAGDRIEHPSIATPRPPERLSSDSRVVAVREGAALQLDHGTVALEFGLRGLRMTPGDAEGPSSTSGQAAAAFEGWLSVGERFGHSVAKARDRAAPTSGAVGQPSPDLATFISYIRKIHVDASSIRLIAESGPPETAHQSTTRGTRHEEHRSRLSGFADLRVMRRVAAQAVLLAAQERDRADERLMPLRGRVAFGLIALACTLATWLALSGFLLESWSGVNPMLVHGCIVGGSLIGFLSGAIVPWLVERFCMERADRLLGGNVRQSVEDRIADIEAIRSDIIRPADERRREHSVRIAWEQAVNHCQRLRRIIEKAIADARVPGLAARVSLEAAVPDEFRNLWREDSSEFRDATVLADQLSESDRGLMALAVAQAFPTKRSQSPAAGMATRVSESEVPSSRAAQSPASPPAPQSINEYATQWTSIADRLDPACHAHLPSHRLHVELGLVTSSIRASVAQCLSDGLVERFTKGSPDQIEESVKKHLPSRVGLGFLSSRIAKYESTKGEPYSLLIRHGLPDTLRSSISSAAGADSKGNESEWVTSVALWYREVSVDIQPSEGSDPSAPREILLRTDPVTGGSKE
jgi:hypothetical protein